MLLNLQQKEVKRPSSNPKSERYFWLNSDFIEGNLKHKKGEPIPVHRFSDLVTQTYKSSTLLSSLYCLLLIIFNEKSLINS